MKQVKFIKEKSFTTFSEGMNPNVFLGLKAI
jgi:hypothetical protein